MKGVWGLVLAFGALGSGLFVLPKKSLDGGAASSEEAAAKLKLQREKSTEPTTFTGMNLGKIAIDDSGPAVRFGDNRVAKLSIDPTVQKVAEAIMTVNHVPMAAVVLMDTATGRVLAYASHVEGGTVARDLCVESDSPAASVFKIVTGATLVDAASLTPDTKECYSGGEQRINASDLEPNPARDHWCTTLGGAMGLSTNTVFARLASRHLKRDDLDAKARALGFGQPVSFDVAVTPSQVDIPQDALGFARSAAGFVGSTLSPIHAAWLSATIARGGEPVRPYIVNEVVDATAKVTFEARPPYVQKRALSLETAKSVTDMMEHTVSEGTSFKAFHDRTGKPFLPGMNVAGKTGTLADSTGAKLYTWFTGFAPSRPIAGVKQVAVAALVVNNPSWRIKANVLAREVLRAYFAGENVPQVTMPKPQAIK